MVWAPPWYTYRAGRDRKRRPPRWAYPGRGCMAPGRGSGCSGCSAIPLPAALWLIIARRGVRLLARLRARLDARFCVRLRARNRVRLRARFRARPTGIRWPRCHRLPLRIHAPAPPLPTPPCHPWPGRPLAGAPAALGAAYAAIAGRPHPFSIQVTAHPAGVTWPCCTAVVRWQLVFGQARER